MNPSPLQTNVEHHLGAIYTDSSAADLKTLGAELIELMGLTDKELIENRRINHWDQTHSLVITYGDSVLRDDEKPLQTLNRFLDKYLRSSVSGVHILPFYPFTHFQWVPQQKSPFLQRFVFLHLHNFAYPLK